ncbi:hypothetical protein WG66_009830 [Moniliophthora roreri]|nr:hypothetical protein WG66_009830 [Moniliophthora roreri]
MLNENLSADLLQRSLPIPVWATIRLRCAFT